MWWSHPKSFRSTEEAKTYSDSMLSGAVPDCCFADQATTLQLNLMIEHRVLNALKPSAKEASAQAAKPLLTAAWLPPCEMPSVSTLMLLALDKVGSDSVVSFISLKGIQQPARVIRLTAFQSQLDLRQAKDTSHHIIYERDRRSCACIIGLNQGPRPSSSRVCDLQHRTPAIPGMQQRTHQR